jgi:hypothetical protein
MPDSHRDLEGLRHAVALAHDRALEPVAPEIHAEGRARLLAVAESSAFSSGRMRRPRRVLQIGALAMAAAVALAVGVGSYLGTRPLTYEVHGGSTFESDYLSVRPDSPAEVRFSDGTEVEAEPGTRLRVDETRNNGARVLLERGTATAQVKHAEHSSWLFVAGPFEVHVTGTKFRLTWDPLKEEVDLTLREGSVEVESPLARGRFAVRAHQRFHASLFDRTMGIEDIGSPSTRMAEPGPVGSAPPQEVAAAEQPMQPTATVAPIATGAPPNPVPNPSRSRHIVGAPVHRESWSDLVGRGEFAAVVSAAQVMGIDTCLASCSAAEVRALADAARYTERSDLAEKSLLALRQRFSSSRDSNAAAFLLGRTEESRGLTGPAEHWYDVYLNESPNGEFAADALAGRMRTVSHLRGPEAAKPLALEYLRRYPDGVHAAAARKIAELH